MEETGTVITTGNIPTTIMMPSEYSLDVKAFIAIAASTHLGQNAKDGFPEGSFTFTDASDNQPTFETLETKANSFNVRATGGVKFITGYTSTSPRGTCCQSFRELGVVLEAKSSAWSILSDQDRKTKVAPVDDLDTLEKVKDVVVSTWRYQGHRVTHMGAMAQDFKAAFGVGEASDRISTLDADGVNLSALRGLTQLWDGLGDSLESLHARLVTSDGRVQEHALQIAHQDKRLSSVLEELENLEYLVQSLHNNIS
jgi:hypothetical protein